MTEHIEAFITSVSGALRGNREGAIVAVSAMVGALALSRVVADSDRSDLILKAVREYLKALDVEEESTRST